MALRAENGDCEVSVLCNMVRKTQATTAEQLLHTVFFQLRFPDRLCLLRVRFTTKL